MKIRKQIPVFAAVALGAFVGFGAGTLLYEKGVEDGGAGKREAITAAENAAYERANRDWEEALDQGSAISVECWKP